MCTCYLNHHFSALKVVGLARRVEKVEELSKILEGKSGKLHAVKCDVSNKDDVIKAFKWIKDNLGPVSILINNAGLYKHGTIMGEICLVMVKWFF